MLGIGMIGLGRHGSRYARHILEDLTDAALVAGCRRNRPEGEKLAAAYRCACHDDSFVRALREGTAIPISIDDGLCAVAIADAAYRSAERGAEGAVVAGFSGAP